MYKSSISRQPLGVNMQNTILQQSQYPSFNLEQTYSIQRNLDMSTYSLAFDMNLLAFLNPFLLAFSLIIALYYLFSTSPSFSTEAYARLQRDREGSINYEVRRIRDAIEVLRMVGMRVKIIPGLLNRVMIEGFNPYFNARDPPENVGRGVHGHGHGQCVCGCGCGSTKRDREINSGRGHEERYDDGERSTVYPAVFAHFSTPEGNKGNSCNGTLPLHGGEVEDLEEQDIEEDSECGSVRWNSDEGTLVGDGEEASRFVIVPRSCGEQSQIQGQRFLYPPTPPLPTEPFGVSSNSRVDPYPNPSNYPRSDQTFLLKGTTQIMMVPQSRICHGWQDARRIMKVLMVLHRRLLIVQLHPRQF